MHHTRTDNSPWRVPVSSVENNTRRTHNPEGQDGDVKNFAIIEQFSPQWLE